MKQATPPTAAAPTKPAVNNSVFYNAINEEIVHFDSELAALRSRVNGLSVEVSNISVGCVPTIDPYLHNRVANQLHF